MTDHPTELLEKAAGERASSTERAALEVHLATCMTCRIELAFARDRLALGTELQGDPLIVARIRRSALRSLAARAVRRRWRLPHLRVAIVAALAFSCAGAAAAWLIREPPRPETPPVQSTPAAASVSRAGVAKAPGLTAKTPETAAASSPAPALAVPLPDPERSARNRAEMPEDRAPASAAELFAAANRARRAGEMARAAAIYRRLTQDFPGSQEALVSKVTLGRMLLDREGDPAGALAQYNGYLAHNGNRALREEALIGRALSLGRLGRRADERAAWQHLLRTFPQSAYAKHARTRLAELDLAAPAKE